VPSTKFFIIANEGKEYESVVRLARIGYDTVIGFLRGGIEAYKANGNPLDIIKNINGSEVLPDMTIIDVRNPTELEHGHV